MNPPQIIPLEPGNRIQLPADWAEALGLHGTVAIERTGDGILVRPCPLVREPSESLEERFQRLAAAWHKAVAHHSSTAVRNNHPAYREIISLGLPVVPLLLRDLEANQTHWFCALREITGSNPIPSAAAGNVPLMVEAWPGSPPATEKKRIEFPLFRTGTPGTRNLTNEQIAEILDEQDARS